MEPKLSRSFSFGAKARAGVRAVGTAGPVAWAFGVWIVLAWQGGLHPWQQAVAALLLAVLVWNERARVPAWAAVGPTEKVLTLVLGFSVLSVSFSLRPQTTLNAVAGLGLALLAAFILRRRAPSPRQVGGLLMYGGVVFSSLFVGLEFFGRALAAPWADTLTIARWIFPNQNLLAAGLVVPAVLLALVRWSENRGPAWPTLGYAALGLLAVVDAGSRGAYLALAAGASWLLWRAHGLACGRRLRAGVLLALTLAAGLAVWAPFSRLAARVRAQAAPGLQDPNYYRRADFWRGAWALSARRPWVGQGLGCFAAAANALDLPTPLGPSNPVARYPMVLDHAHNEWLELAVEVGWPVTLALALCLVGFAYRRLRSGALSPSELGLEAVLVAALAVSLVDMNLRTPALGWGLMLCCVALEPGLASEGATGPSAFGGKLALALAVLAVGCLLGEALGHRLQRDPAAHVVAPDLARAALFLQPLDSGVARSALSEGQESWAWSDWAGRTDPAWWWMRAGEAKRGGDENKAVTDAQAAVHLRPFYAPGWYWLGLLLNEGGQGLRAAACMDKALLLEPNFCRVLALKADQAGARGDRAERKRLVREVLAIRSLKSHGENEYTHYLQSVDAAWLDANAADER